VKGKKKTGRPGMDLWVLFVMAQTRLCLNISYDELHRMANNDKMFREIMGIETEDGFERIEFEYQNNKMGRNIQRDPLGEIIGQLGFKK
jgi:hypothetical protein